MQFLNKWYGILQTNCQSIELIGQSFELIGQSFELIGQSFELIGWPPVDLRNEMLYLSTHSTHFIYSYMASDTWLRTILIVRKETHSRHIGYSFRLTARVLLYVQSHRQDSIYSYNSSMGPPWRIDPTTHRTMSEHSYHGATSRSYNSSMGPP